MQSKNSFSKLALALLLVSASVHAQQPQATQMSDKELGLGAARVIDQIQKSSAVLGAQTSSSTGSGSSTAASTATGLSASQINDLKNSVLTNNRLIGKDGRTLDANGNIVKGSSSSAALDSQYTPGIVKNVLGLDLTNGSTQSGVLQTNRSVVINCKTPNSNFSLDGISFKNTVCSMQNNAPSGIETDFCDKGLFGGSCSLSSDTYHLKVPSGSKIQNASSYSYQVNCDAQSCTISGGVSASIQNNQASVNAAVAAYKQNATQDSAFGASQLTGQSKTVFDQYQQTRSDLADCLKQQQAAKRNGQPIPTCDGSTTVTGSLTTSSDTSSVGGSGSTAEQCTASSKSCLRKGYVQTDFTQTCTETYQSTSLRCPYKLSTLQCDVSYAKNPALLDAKGNKYCSDSETLVGDFCYRKTDSCSSLDRQNFTIAKTTQGSCTKYPGTDFCQSYTDYLWDPNHPQQSGDCQAAPYPLDGPAETSCANKGNGEFLECQSGGWWLRTRPDSECTSTQLISSGSDTQSYTVQYSEDQRPGCGYCVAPVRTDACRGPKLGTSCTLVNAQSCTLDSQTCTGINSVGDNSICTSTEKKYSCTKVDEVCTQYSSDSSCKVSANTYGIENLTSSVQDTSQQIGDLAVGIGITRAATQSTSGLDSLPRIFDGTPRRCRVPKNIISAAGIGNNCCDINLERAGGSKGTLFERCDMDEVRLAGARRKARTVYVPGPWCSKSIKVSRFLRICVEDSYGYCDFNDKISRIIQEQGREQLIKFASSIQAGSQSKTYSFNYFGDSDQGAWKDLGTLQNTHLLAWQWPSSCKTPSVDNTGTCPERLETWFAACDDASQCKELPLSPWFTTGAWITTSFDPLSNQKQAISRFAMAEGACTSDTNVCSYAVKAFPYGQGGRAVLTRHTSWPMKVQQATQGQYLILGNVVLKPEILPNQDPTSSRLNISTDGGATFATYTVPNEKDFSLNSGVSGNIHCDSYTGICNADFTGLVQVDLKPWGSGESRDCSGFTVSQISAMDFGRMDFSEWIADLQSQAQFKADSNASNLVKSQIQTYMDDTYSGNTRSIQNDELTRAVSFSTLQAFGPFDLIVSTQGNWPMYSGDPAKDTDPVTSMTVNFDNCGPDVVADAYLPDGRRVKDLTPEDLQAVTSNLRVFKAQYSYPSPADTCHGHPDQDTIHHVVAKVVSASGTHLIKQDITNIWKDPKPVYAPDADLNGTINQSHTVIPNPPPPQVIDQVKDMQNFNKSNMQQ